MKNEVWKWWRTIQLSVSNQLAYKFNFALVVLGPALVFFFIKYNLWSSIYTLGGHDSIRGYTLAGMLAYQAWVLIVKFLVNNHNGRDMAEDIRLGRISSYLVYPFDFWKFHTGSFLGFQGVAVVIAFVTASLLSLGGLITIPEPHALASGLLLCLLVGLLWFQIQFLLALLAFWLEETWVLRVIFLIVAEFLSGAVIPLDLFPSSFVKALSFTPFPYLTYFPVKIMMGEELSVLPIALTNLCIWSMICFLLTRLVWRSGMKMYTGAGM